jgi:hypothetical protein
MVWISQYRQYVAERIRSPCLEEPPESYSAQDLECWVLVRRSADVGWKRNDVKITQTRYPSECPSVIGAMCLVPGGQWLLVGDARHGSVTVYDLNMSTLAGRLLIPPDSEGAHPVGHSH